MINPKNVKPHQIKKKDTIKLEKPIRFSSLDIIVPFHGQYQKVSALLKSLWNTSTNYRNKVAITQGMVYNLCLVDDASPNRSFMEEIDSQKYPGVICIRNEERKGFGASLEAGFNATKSPAVVFLHSDCQIIDINWLKGLVETFARNPKEKIGIVSSKLSNCSSGTSQVKYNKMEGTKDIILRPASVKQIIDEEMHVPLISVLCKRDIFAKIGGFVKSYPLGWYEDLELGCRMHAKGYLQVISGASHMIHSGAATINEIISKEENAGKIIENNFELCCADLRTIPK